MTRTSAWADRRRAGGRPRTNVVLVTALLFLTACGTSRARPAQGANIDANATDASIVQAQLDGAHQHPSPEGQRVAASLAEDSLLLVRGKEIVTTVCATCHTEQPPAKLAPPLAHVSQRYRMMVGERDSALARLTAWIATPSAEHSLMPSMAIQRFGLMPPLPLPVEQRQAAAAYVWSLSEGSPGMQGMHGKQGMQDMHGKQGVQGKQGHGAGAAPRRPSAADSSRTPPPAAPSARP